MALTICRPFSLGLVGYLQVLHDNATKLRPLSIQMAHN